MGVVYKEHRKLLYEWYCGVEPLGSANGGLDSFLHQCKWQEV
jgi:hypothetical protein